MEKGSGKYFNEKWFCRDECLEKYIELNQEILLNQQEISNEKLEYNSEDEDQEEIENDNLSMENDGHYDPMTDF
jgi:protein-tyrosine phosphatase